MPGSRSYSTEAIVLRQRRLGDADKIITVFTPNLGRVDMVAKGVRRPKSRLAGHVEVLSHCNLLVHRGRSLDIVAQAQLIENFRRVRESLSLVSRAIYAAELVERFTDASVDSFPTFQLLVATLRRLAETSSPDIVLRCFEMALLDELGYRPQLEACVACGGPLVAATNFYSGSAGGAGCSDCRANLGAGSPLTVNALKVMRLMQRAPAEEVALIAMDGPLLAELERHLHEHINFTLEREVKSAAFLREVQRQERRDGLTASTHA
jgi:DNA repair protein RecO (recombination protein O)